MNENGIRHGADMLPVVRRPSGMKREYINHLRIIRPNSPDEFGCRVGENLR